MPNTSFKACVMYRPIRGWKPTTPPITAANYEAVCNAHQNVAIHFWAEWNGVDPPFDREIANLPPEILALVHFVSCHIDDPQNEPLRNRLSIATVPSLAIVVNGRFNGSIVGMRTSDELGPELVNRFSLPIAITTTKPRQISKCCMGDGLACFFKWLRRFRPREH